MGSVDVQPTVPRVDLYHCQNTSLPRLELEKGWIIELDPINFGPIFIRLTKTNKIRNQRTCRQLQYEERLVEDPRADRLRHMPCLPSS